MKDGKIISYICFENAEAFEKWQIENPTNKVAAVAPVIGGMNLDMQGSDMGCMAEASSNVKTFVTYIKTVDTDTNVGATG